MTTPSVMGATPNFSGKTPAGMMAMGMQTPSAGESERETLLILLTLYMDFIARYLWLLKSQKYQPLKTYFIEMARRDLICMQLCMFLYCVENLSRFRAQIFEL